MRRIRQPYLVLFLAVGQASLSDGGGKYCDITWDRGLGGRRWQQEPGEKMDSTEGGKIPAAAAGDRPRAEEKGQESRDQSDIDGMASGEELVYLGEFEVTGYCDCDICCGKKEVKLTKMETVPKPEYTVAADPDVIPLGSYIVVDGVTYRVEDIGQAVKGKSLDIFFADHQEAIEFGRQKRSVYLKQSL